MLEVKPGHSYFQGMKRILTIAITILTSGSAVLCAQPATGPSSQEINENIKHLQATVDDLNAAQDDLRKQIQSLAREISDLREKAAKPAGNFASPDDIKRLADAIQEVDRKRQADNEKMIAELSKVAKTLGSAVRTRPEPKTNVTPPANDPGTGQNPPKDQDGFYYKVKAGDSFSSIARAYREQGVKVYTSDIEKANPGVDSSKLKVDQKIFIPAPKDKDKAK